MLLALPVLFGLWLGLGIFGSALVALGYGFSTPWISTFEAFRQESEAKKFVHGIVVRHCSSCGSTQAGGRSGAAAGNHACLITDNAEMVPDGAGRDMGHDQGQLHGG